MSHCINLRRSAILTEIVTRFMISAESLKLENPKHTSLFDFLEECHAQIQSKRKLFDSLNKEE